MINKIKKLIDYPKVINKRIRNANRQIAHIEEKYEQQAKIIEKLQISNKKLSKVIKREQEARGLTRLRCVESILDEDIYNHYHNVKWSAVFSDIKAERIEYWQELYRKKEIEIAENLKLLSRTYFINENSKKKDKVKYGSNDIKLFFKENLLVENESNLFSDYVKNKKIRLRGPTAKKITFFDDEIITVVMNAVHLEEKVDVSYYSSERFIKDREHILGLLEQGLIKFAIVNNPSLGSSDVPEIYRGRILFIHHFDKGFDAHLLGVQRIVYDLICRGANKIEIEGVNLYSKLPYHNEEYKALIKTAGDELLNSWAKHDVVFNFCFLKASLNYKNSKVEIIDEFSYLLNLSKDDYISIITSNINNEFKNKEGL